MGLAEFIEYQQEFRLGPAALGNITAEWNAKSAAEKSAWTKARNAERRQREKVAAQQLDADGARNDLNDDYDDDVIVINTVAEYEQFQDRVDGVQSQYEDLKPEYERWAELWQGLHDAESAHANAFAPSLAFALRERDRKGRGIGLCENQKTALDRLLETPPVAQDPQGRPRMPDHYLPTGRRWQILQARKVQRARDGHRPGLQGDDNQIWRVGSTLGGGESFGTLWLRFDDQTHTIVDRVFRKDCLMSEEAWFDPTRWEGDMRSQNDKMPLELVVTHQMDRVANLQNTVRMRVAPNQHQHVDDATLTFKMYLEWMGKGTLTALIDRHRRNGTRIPEPMIWYVAEALALCGSAMFQGAVPNENGNVVAAGGWMHALLNGRVAAPADWMEVVHRDLKPANVFLEDVSNANPAIYPHYDRPILGDYGLAIKTSATDVYNPRWYNNRLGTFGFLSPEQGKHLNAQTKETIDEWRLGEKTNVYGIGLILWCMVMRRVDPPEAIFLGDPAQDNTLDLLAAVTVHYDPLLTTLIRDCLAYRQDQRPSVNHMLDRIRIATDEAAAAANRSQNMRSGNANHGQRLGNMPTFQNDRYQMGFAAGAVGVAI